MKVRFTETALVEIDEIFSFIAKENPTAAASVVDRARATIARLGQFPHLGQAASENGIRLIQAGRFPYLILYTVEQNDVVILHVRHAARRRPWDEAR